MLFPVRVCSGVVVFYFCAVLCLFSAVFSVALPVSVLVGVLCFLFYRPVSILRGGCFTV